jgi:hypothetical protein
VLGWARDVSGAWRVRSPGEVVGGKVTGQPRQMGHGLAREFADTRVDLHVLTGLRGLDDLAPPRYITT